MAFEKCITIQELILKAILKTYYQMVMDGVLKPDKTNMKRDLLFQDMINGHKSMANVIEDFLHEECHDQRENC